MNKLQKKAWTDLTIVTVCMLICCFIFSIMVHLNTKGLSYILIFLIVGVPTGFICWLKECKNELSLDEREKKIKSNAFSCSTKVFIFYLFCFAFTAFFLIGGKGQVPVWFLPVMTFSGLFIAQAVMSAVILAQFAMEETDGK